jgi:hypothetical protein
VLINMTGAGTARRCEVTFVETVETDRNFAFFFYCDKMVTWGAAAHIPTKHVPSWVGLIPKKEGDLTMPQCP